MDSNFTNVTLTGNNVTDNNVTVSENILLSGYMTLIQVFVTVLCPMSLIFSTMTLCVVWKCKSMSFPVRCISTMFLGTQTAAQLVLTIHQLILLMTNTNSVGFRISRSLSTHLFISLSRISVAALAMERAVALSFPFSYSNWNTNKRTLISVVLFAVVNLIICGSPIVYGLLRACVYHTTRCDFTNVVKPQQETMLYIIILYEFATATSYFVIVSILRRHLRQIASMQTTAGSIGTGNSMPVSGQQIKSANAIIYIVVISFILHTPYLVQEIAADLMTIKTRILLSFFAFVCIEVNALVSGCLYVWKFQEFRLHFITMFLSCIPHYRKKAERMRLTIFNIVTFTGTTNDHGFRQTGTNRESICQHVN